ncbi:hypothetical protein FACS1894211_03770 [Clostridia bacterium]|nr:hypothetical protein FACS1894211_03770 [Clostridia bacterium]
MKDTSAELVDKLILRYGYNEPILTDEIRSTWSEYSRTRVFQLIKKLTENKMLQKFDMGVYYVPTSNLSGKQSYLFPRQVIEKKYIRFNDEVYGYYAGLVIQNSLGLTTQMPVTKEVVTNNETTRVREVRVGKSKVLLRRSKTHITRENAAVLQFLDALKEADEPLDEYQLGRIREFVQQEGIKQADIYKYANLFPQRAIVNLRHIGEQNVFAH